MTQIRGSHDFFCHSLPLELEESKLSLNRTLSFLAYHFIHTQHYNNSAYTATTLTQVRRASATATTQQERWSSIQRRDLDTTPSRPLRLLQLKIPALILITPTVHLADIMVQFNEDHQRWSPRRELRDYWKLCGTYRTVSELLKDMRKLNYRCKSSGNMSKQRAVFLYSRAERGLLSYETLTKPELQLFCNQRGLDTKFKSVPRVTQKALRECLEQADEDATFDGLTRLPAELRLNIMEFFFMSLSEALQDGFPKVQPPISRSCQLLRRESLPVFYSQISLHLKLYSALETCALIDRTHEDFVRTTSEHSFARLRKLDLLCPAADTRSSYAMNRFELSLDVARGDCHVRLVDRSKKTPIVFPAIKEIEQCAAKLKKECQTVLDVIVVREGPHKFRKDDLDGLFQAFFDAIKNLTNR